ncbi:hypothetical protein Slin15195_G111440 [Septoria linicola]|uniref:Uncharacterized protein n=1 Tax=Septoria linicola TaxID=215465 RepID=A0A9Q9EP79_9PEZI|nr:hypothetical protein Slin15195_G111440 [Septoria linicola]
MFRPLMRRVARNTRLPSRPFTSRAFLRHEQQQQPQYQAPTSPAPAKVNPHRQVYKQGGMGRAVAYNFLVAMVTFQVLYWSWLKLESIETKQEKQTELDTLQTEVETLTGFKGKGKDSSQ